MYTIQKKTVARLVTTGMAVALLASPISSIARAGACRICDVYCGKVFP